MSTEAYPYWPPDVPPLATVTWPKHFTWYQGQLLAYRRKAMVVAATGVVVITERYQDEAGLVYCRVWYERDQHWNSVVIPLDALTQAEGMRILTKVGVPVATPGVLREFLWAWYALNSGAMPTHQVPHQGGWWQDRYVWGKTVWDHGDRVQDDLFVLSEDARQWQTLQQVPDAWVETARKAWNWWATKVLPEAPALSIGLAAMGGALLLEPYAQPNFLLHIADQTSTGKTTTLELLASCLGVPYETNGLVRKWQTPPEALAAWVRWMRDSLWFLDDATRMTAGSLTDIVYWLASGNPPLGTGTTRGIAISTSELPMPSEPGGTLARTLSWDQSWIPPGAPVDKWHRYIQQHPDQWGWALGGLLLQYHIRKTALLERVWVRPPPPQATGVERRWHGYWNTLVAGSKLWPARTVGRYVLQAETAWWDQYFKQKGAKLDGSHESTAPRRD